MDEKVKACSLCKTFFAVSNFNKKSASADGLQNVCKTCNKVRSDRHYRENREARKKVLRAQLLQRKRLAQQYVINYLQSNPCVDCKESDIVVLDFDHVRGEKTNAICTMVGSGATLEKVVLEIEKCEVRCANCHRRKTANERNWYKSLV